MARVLITGATGFIGSHLARACVVRGDDVTLVVRPSSDLARVSDLSAQLQIHRVLLTDQPAMHSCMKDAQPEVIFHLGARTRFTKSQDLSDFATSIDDNLKTLLGIVSAAATLPAPPSAFVRAGTIAEYGSVAPPYREDMREAPNSAYGASLLAGTQCLEALRPRLPFATSTARLALTYGPGQSRDFLLPSLIHTCLNNEPFIVARPEDRRDLIHVSDVVSALLRLADLEHAAPGLVNIGTGRAPTMRALAKLVINATGASPDVIRFGDQEEDDVVELRIDPTRQRQQLQWSPRIDLEEGVAMTVDDARATRPNGTNRRSA